MEDVKIFESLSAKTIIFFFVVLSIVLIILFVIFFVKLKFSKTEVCGDGTFYGNCSVNKPYFCFNGTLIENVSSCGCPEILMQAGNSCNSIYKINPRNVSLNYLLEDKIGNLTFTVYEEFYEYTRAISRLLKGNQSVEDMKIKIIENKEQREMILPLVVEIQNFAKNENDQMKIAISLVQLIQYDNSSNNFSILYQAINSRYPYEVLYDMKGVCGEKSNLLIFLLKELGYGVAVFYFPDENHEAVGIKCSSSYDFNESGYCFIETTGLIGESGNKYIGATRKFNDFKIFEISDGKELEEEFFE